MNIGPCQEGSLDEWLMERYTAFTSRGGSKRFFRVWHPTWAQVPAEAVVMDDGLLRATWPLFSDARPSGANFSPAARNVWLGWPHRLEKQHDQ
jgi:uncharacterized protein YqjF (DUF2071 family)